MRRDWRRLLPADNNGVAAVEFALILMPMMYILLGVVDLGRAFYSYEALANAVREGARYCAMHPADSAGTKSRITGELDARVAADTSATECPAPEPSPGGGNQVTVQANTTFTPLTPFMSEVLTGSSTGSITMTVTATMAVWGSL